MELKLDGSVYWEHSELTPIAPLWNWNFLLLWFVADCGRTPIAPLWNWNFSELQIIRNTKGTPIAPLWNWNIFGKITQRLKMQNSNRTFMELKCRNSSDTQSCIVTPIAPLWNWNKKETSKRNLKLLTPIAPLWNWNA